MKLILRAGYHDYFVVTKDALFSMRHFRSERDDKRIDPKDTHQ
jgi:hypothetical protein